MTRTFPSLIFGAVLLITSAVSVAADVPVPPPPSIDAASYILMDYRTGQVLAEKNADAHREPASTTKLMTAFITFQDLAAGRIKPDTKFTVSEKAWKQIGSRMFLKPGTQVSVNDLLQGLLIPSGNDAAMALAEGIGGTASGFVNMMNATAHHLGLQNTHYADPTGLPADNLYTSAHDLAILSRATIRDFPQYYHYFSEKDYTWNNIHQYNWNKLLWLDPTVDGLKTGYTENAGYCLAASAKRGDQRMIAVVMGVSAASKTDNMANYKHLAQVTDALLNYGFRFFETHEVEQAGKTLGKIRVWKGAEKFIDVGLAKSLYVTLPTGHLKQIKVETQLKKQVTAPVKNGAPLGQLKVTDSGKVIASAPLVALKAVPAGGFWPQLRDSVLQLF